MTNVKMLANLTKNLLQVCVREDLDEIVICR